MARGVNKVFLVGNIGHDPEPRQTNNGNTVVNLNLATDESYKDRQTGQLVPKTEWHRIVMFGKVAEIAGQYVRKGSKIYIEGKLQTRKWQDQNGQDRYTTEILVDINGQMQMLDSPNRGGQQDQPTGHQQPPPAASGQNRQQPSYADVKDGKAPPPQQPSPVTYPEGSPVQNDDSIPF